MEKSAPMTDPGAVNPAPQDAAGAGQQYRDQCKILSYWLEPRNIFLTTQQYSQCVPKVSMKRKESMVCLELSQQSYVFPRPVSWVGIGFMVSFLVFFPTWSYLPLVSPLKWSWFLLGLTQFLWSQVPTRKWNVHAAVYRSLNNYLFCPIWPTTSLSTEVATLCFAYPPFIPTYLLSHLPWCFGRVTSVDLIVSSSRTTTTTTRLAHTPSKLLDLETKKITQFRVPAFKLFERKF